MKRVFGISAILLTATLLLWAASEGPNSPSSGATDGGAGTAWTSPGNITASDDSRAQAALAASQNSEALQATQFGFSIPVGSVDGVEAKIEHQRSGGTGGVCEDLNVRLLIAGVASGNDKATAGAWNSGSDAIITYGGAADLWGLTPTVAQVNATNFGFHVSAQETSAADSINCLVDHMTLTVTFTSGVGGRRRIITRNGGTIITPGAESELSQHSQR